MKTPRQRHKPQPRCPQRPWKHEAAHCRPGDAESRTDGRAGRRTGQPMRVARAGRKKARSTGAHGADAEPGRGPGGRPGRSQVRPPGRRRPPPVRSARGAGRLPGPPQAPPAPVRALGRARLVGFGLSGSGRAAPEAVGVRLSHDRDLGLSPSAHRRHEGQRGLQGPATHGETRSASSSSSTPSLTPRTQTLPAAPRPYWVFPLRGHLRPGAATVLSNFAKSWISRRKASWPPC